MFRAKFSSFYGSVCMTALTQEEIQKAFDWFSKHYFDAKIERIEELPNGSTKEKLYFQRKH